MSDFYFLIVGVLLTAFGVFYPVLTIRRRVSCRETIVATVKSLERKKHYYKGHTTHRYFPTLTYTVDGRTYTTASDTGSLNMYKYQVGNEVTIRYNPDAPETICVGAQVFPYVCGALFIPMGVTLIVCFFL